MSFRDSDVAKKFSEIDELVRTVELVGEDNNSYRLDVRDTARTPDRFLCRVYKLVRISVTPVFEEQFKNGAEVDAWTVVGGFPRSYGDTADDALREAMRFLADLIAKKVGR